MKTDRPDNPGTWYYINNYDYKVDQALVGRRYGRKTGPLQVFHIENNDWSDFEEFEKCEVHQWIGEGRPPKGTHAELYELRPPVQKELPKQKCIGCETDVPYLEMCAIKGKSPYCKKCYEDWQSNER